MKKWILPIFVVLTLLFTGLGIYITQAQKPVETAVYTPQTKPADIPLNADKILELVNAERQKAGVAPLVSDPRLVATAQARADDMVARNYFAHRDPVTDENMVKALPYCAFTSENISIMNDPLGDNNQETITGWINSKPHHDAMLDAKYSLTGVAISSDKVVQHFCRQ